MSARYAVLQYLPDPSTDERINFGVVVFGEDRLRTRFVKNWGRIRSFGGPNTDFLRGFARELEVASDDQTTLPFVADRVEPNDFFDLAAHWKNSIQLTEPRASTLPVDALLEEVSRRFLPERIPRRRVRDRRAAASIAVRALDTALKAHGSRKPDKYIARNEDLEGSHDHHRFDVALVNGTAHLGVLAMSFAGGNASELDREVRANAWTIDDVHDAAPEFPIAVVTIPPSRVSKTYRHAADLFKSLGAQVVTEGEVSPWADEATRSIYRNLVARK